MDQQIKIMAEPVTSEPNQCKFTLENEIVERGSFRFENKEAAVGSALAESLFGIENVESVYVSAKAVVVAKKGEEDWRSIGPKIGVAIRAALESGKDLISQKLRDDLPDESELRTIVENVLTDEINPAVAAHGGHIELLDVKSNDIFLKMGGGCQGCGMASATLKQGVEEAIRKKFPDLGTIYDTTDHASGMNPYYQAGK